jgi:hypothetical protein
MFPTPPQRALHVAVLVEVHHDEVVELGGIRPRRIAKRELDPPGDEAALGVTLELRDPAFEPLGNRHAVGVEQRQHLAGRDREPTVAGRVRSGLGLVDESHTRKLGDDRVQVFARAVVHHDHFVAIGGIRLRGERGEAAPERRGAVVGRNDDRHERGRSGRHDAATSRSRPSSRSLSVRISKRSSTRARPARQLEPALRVRDQLVESVRQSWDVALGHEEPGHAVVDQLGNAAVTCAHDRHARGHGFHMSETGIPSWSPFALVTLGARATCAPSSAARTAS